MTPDQFESHFLNVWHGSTRIKQWLHINRLPLGVILFLAASALLSLSFAAPSYVPNLCRNVDGVEMCIVTKENLDKLIASHDDAITRLRKTSADCKRLNES